MNRKDKTVKQLQAECRKRKIGFMMNWTKAALVKRLEDEDNREKEILGLKEQLKKETLKLKKELLKKDKTHKMEIHLATKSAKKPLVEAQRKLKEEVKLLEGYETRINIIIDEKFKLMEKSQKVRHSVEQLEVLIKSLI